MRRDYDERTHSKENKKNSYSFKYSGRPISPYQPNSGTLVEKKLSLKFWNKIKYKLNKKPYYNRFCFNKFSNSLVWMVILSFTFGIIYYNIDTVNKIVLFFPLGSILLLINGIFWIKYTYQLLKGVVYWYRDQRNWMKYLIVLIVLFLALQSYQQKQTIFNPLIDFTSQTPRNTGLKIDLEKEVVGWWDETKPKAEFNSATYDIENIVFNKVNEERRTQGLNALIWDSKLAEVARLHSLDMANRSYFSHENPEGEDPTMRARRNGYYVHKELGNGWYSDGIAENIGMMPTGNVEGYGYVNSPNDVADAMMQSWMNSPGHRANILKADYNFIGVGVAYNGYGTYYLTQDFK